MYPDEGRIRAVKLCIKLGKRLSGTICQLGYPTIHPSGARVQHRQRMAQVEYGIDARSGKIVGGGTGKQHSRNSRK